MKYEIVWSKHSEGKNTKNIIFKFDIYLDFM